MPHFKPQHRQKMQRINSRGHKDRFSGEAALRRKPLKHQFEAIEVHSTDKAILLLVDGEEIWFPRSMVTWVSKGTYECSINFAKEKGLIE
jgi:hypothetical protein